MFKSRVLAVKWKLSFSSPISKPTPMILLVVLFIRKLFVVLSANITVLTSWGLADVSMEVCSSVCFAALRVCFSFVILNRRKKKRKKERGWQMYGIRIWGAVGVFRQEFNYQEGMGAAVAWKSSGLFFFIWFYLFIFTPSARIDFWRGNCSVVWCLWVTPCSAERRRGRNFPEINEKEEYIFLALRHKVHTALKRACLCSQL